MIDSSRPDPGADPSAASSGASLAERIGEATRTLEFADPDAGAPPLDRWINRIFELIGVSVLATIVLLVFANAVGRYAASAPILWAEEVVIVLIPWLAMSGVFLSVRRRNVIRLEYFTQRLSTRGRVVTNALASVLSAAAFVHLAFYSFQYVSLFGRDVTTYLKLPTGWFTSAMLIGALAVAAAFLVGLVRDLKAHREQLRR